MQILNARTEHWPQIWRILIEVVDAADTYAYPPRLTEQQGRELWLEAAPGRTVVAVDADGRVLGTAKMGANRPGPGSHVATASFMVAEDARGRGVGRALGEHVVDWAAGQGFRGIQFNAVVETNLAAVALWKSLGFEVVGTVPEAFRHPRHGYVGLHVMYLPLVDRR